MDPAQTQKLAEVLAEFVYRNQRENPGLRGHLEVATMKSDRAMRECTDYGTAVLGAANVLLDFIKEGSKNEMHFTNDYPPKSLVLFAGFKPVPIVYQLRKPFLFSQTNH
jgi:hypothetical protein